MRPRGKPRKRVAAARASHPRNTGSVLKGRINMLPSIFGENLFDEFFDSGFDKSFFGNNPLYGKRGRNLMKTDVREHENGYEVDIDLPGFKKEDIKLDLNNGYLTVSAAKGLDKDEQDKKGRFIRQERWSGACTRSFYVGDVKPEDVKARYEHGVLSLSLPKAYTKELEGPSHIAIT